MNDAHVTKGKIGRLIAKNLIVMLVAVVVALTGVLAWFSQKSSAEASDLSVECKAPDGIEIAVVAKGDKPVNSDFHESHIILKDQAFMKDLKLAEVTSNGISFYRPILNQLGGTAVPDPSKEWEEEDDIINKSYLSFDLYIRSKSEQENIYLEDTSKFSTLAKDLVGEHVDNKSSLGDFSRDCIVGATRMSVVGYKSSDNTPERKLLWIPRPDLQFYTDDNDNTNHVNVDLTDTSGTSYKHRYWGVTTENGTQVRDLEATTMESGVTTSKKVGDDFVLGTKTSITSLSTPMVFSDAAGNDVSYYCNHVTVNIWIEGEDDEARLALVNGYFNVNLNLSLK